MSLSKRRVEVNVKPTMIISCNGDVWSIAIDMKNKGTETIFTEGSEIDTCNCLRIALNYSIQLFLLLFLSKANELKFVFDNRFYFESRRFCKSTFKFDSPNRLVQHMKFTDTEEKQLIVREFDQQTGNLVEVFFEQINSLLLNLKITFYFEKTCEMNGVKATKIYSKS
jgi:hypothetical protein